MITAEEEESNYTLLLNNTRKNYYQLNIYIGGKKIPYQIQYYEKLAEEIVIYRA